MPTLDIPTVYVSNVGMIPASADLNVIRKNCQFVDGLSYQMQPFFGVSDGLNYYHTRDDFYIYRGCLRYASGMTTLHIDGYAANYESNPNDIEIYIYNANGAPDDGKHTGPRRGTVAVNPSWGVDVALTGWNDGDFLFVDVQWDPIGTRDSIVDVIDAYATPVPSIGTWPGAPSWSGSYPATKINQMTTAAQWLFTRMNAMSMLPTMAQMYRQATHKTPGAMLLTGGVHKHYAQDVLHLEMTVTCLTDQERLELRLNGTVVWSSDWYGNNQTRDLVHIHNLSTYATGTAIKATLYANVANGHSSPPNSRYTLRVNHTEPLSAYPAATLPAPFPRSLDIPESDLTARLNTLSAILQDTYNRIQSNSFSWNRQRLFPRRYAQDAHQFSRFVKQYVHRFERRGDRLIVRGKGVAIEWGANTLESEEGEEFNYKFANTQQVTDGDKVETKEVALDSIVGLYPGMTYFVTGTDVQWCAEFWE